MKKEHLTLSLLPVLLAALLACALIACNTKQPATQATEADYTQAAGAHLEHEQAEDGHAETVELTALQYQTAGIDTGIIETKTLSGTLKVNGMLDTSPDKQISISAATGGFVRNLKVQVGMRVNRGTLLATVENQELIQLQQDYAETRSRLEFAELDYKRQQELSGENVTARKTFEQAKAEVGTLRSRRTALEQRLQTLGLSPTQVMGGKMTNRIALVSPASGYITAVNVNAGKYVSPTDLLFEILDTSEPLAKLVVFEQDISRLAIGQRVRLQLAGQAGTEYTARIRYINRKIGENRTVEVRAVLEGSHPDLLPRTFLKGFIELTENAVTALPDGAVVGSEGKDYIFITKGTEEAHDHPGEEKDEAGHDHGQDAGHQHGGEALNYVFELVEVKKGVSEGGYTEITLPEIPGAKTLRVVRKGAYELLSKLKGGGEEGHAH